MLQKLIKIILLVILCLLAQNLTAGMDILKDYVPGDEYTCITSYNLVFVFPVDDEYKAIYQESRDWEVAHYKHHLVVMPLRDNSTLTVRVFNRRMRFIDLKIHSLAKDYLTGAEVTKVLVHKFPKNQMQGGITTGTGQKALAFDHQFSLQGAWVKSDKGRLNIDSDLILNLKTRDGILVQGASMVQVDSAFKRYGVSLGAGYEPANLGLFLFVDGLSYTFGDYNPTLHVQVRPTVRVKTGRFSGTLFYAHGFGDRYTGIDKLVTNDYTISVYNKTLSYVGLSLRGLPFERLFIEAAAIAAPHGVYQVKVESGIELFKKLFLTANAQTSSFGKYPELAMQGFSKNTGFGIGIQYQFGHSEPVRDLRERNIVPVFYPLVVSHEKKVYPKPDDPNPPDPGDPLSVSISGSPINGKAPLSVDFTVTTRSGSSPFQYAWYFAGSGQGAISGTAREQYTYYQPGTYQVYVEVTDARGHKATSNRLSVEVSNSGKYTIMARTHDNAQVKPEGSTLAEPGGDYRFNLSAKDGYKIDRVEVDGQNKGAILEYTFKNVAADHRIEAWAKADNGQKSFKITSIAHTGGYNDPEGVLQVGQASSLKVGIFAASGYRIKEVRIDGKSIGPKNVYAFDNIQADHTIESFFETSQFTIQAIQNPGGTISPAGITTVSLGGSQTYTVSVNPGSQLTDLLVDGQSVGIPQGNTYTFVNVQDNHAIQPLFG